MQVTLGRGETPSTASPRWLSLPVLPGFLGSSRSRGDRSFLSPSLLPGEGMLLVIVSGSCCRVRPASCRGHAGGGLACLSGGAAGRRRSVSPAHRADNPGPLVCLAVCAAGCPHGARGVRVDAQRWLYASYPMTQWREDSRRSALIKAVLPGVRDSLLFGPLALARPVDSDPGEPRLPTLRS